MARPIRAVIDLAAIEDNFELATELAPQASTLAVVKADAYGHGAVEVARALAPKADGFGVAGLEEALTLRDAGIANPILLLTGFFAADELGEIVERRLDTVIHCREQLETLLDARLGAPLRVWLKMDTGMHRLGFAPEAFGEAYRRLSAAPRVSEIVLMTHLANADLTDGDSTHRQAELFRRATRGIDAAATSLANSAALLAWPECHGDWTRPGILLYGSSPLDRATTATKRLRPAMELVSEIVAIRDVAAGEAIGYGGRYVCERPTRLGVVAAGYGDGYPRHAPDGTPVLVDGRRARLAGRVTMDLLTVDLEGVTGAAVGDPVELWGRSLPAREVAEACGTIAYELLTGVSSRVPRRRRSDLRG